MSSRVLRLLMVTTRGSQQDSGVLASESMSEAPKLKNPGLDDMTAKAVSFSRFIILC